MKYETPELTAPVKAITAIQAGKTDEPLEQPQIPDAVSAYEDWEG